MRALERIDLRRLWEPRPVAVAVSPSAIVGRDAVRAAWVKARAPDIRLLHPG